MIVLFALISFIIQWYLIIFPESYTTELIISFVPYIILTMTILSVVLVWMIFFVHLRSQKILITILALISLWLCAYRGQRAAQIYHRWQPTSHSQNTLSILYSNIYYQNTNLSWIIDTIESHDPDVVLLVEYAKMHDTTLTPILRSSYPYTTRYIGSKWYDGDIIFSRYPFQKIPHDDTPGSFSHISLDKDGTIIDLALVHTSAPVSTDFFMMRNTQLAELIDILHTHYNYTTPPHPLMMIGDFNISPWSIYYQSLNTELQQLWLTNESTTISTTQYLQTTIPLTRCHDQLPFICSHIDHVWSTHPTHLQQIHITGSDHYGFVGEIMIP